MGKTQAKKKKPAKLGPNLKTKKRTRDLDQIFTDLESGFQPQKDRDLPGEGQHYCVHCARHFLNKETLEAHQKSKTHRQRVKDLKIKPYTIEESVLAAGMGPVDNGPRLPRRLTHGIGQTEMADVSAAFDAM